MKKIKVLQIIGNLKVGGAENVAMDYYRYINRNKYEFHYLVFTDEIGEYEREVISLGGKVYRLNYSMRNIISFLGGLYKLMKKEKYDIVHSHTLFNSGLTLFIAHKAGIKKRIAHSHSIKNKVYTTKLLNIYEKTMRKFILKYSTDFLASSELAGFFLFGVETFKLHGNVILNGINVDQFSYDSNIRHKIRNKLGLNDNIILGHVGHLAEVKNQKYLLKILHDLDDKKYQLLLVGDGNDRTNLKRIAEDLNVVNQVIFIGNVSNVEDYLSAMDIFLFPSLYEGLGLAVIEAQASGLLVLISNKLPEEVDITELVTRLPIGDKYCTKWVSHVITSNRDKHRSEFSKQVKNSGYDVENTVNSLELIYRKNHEELDL